MVWLCALQLNKANASDSETSFFGLRLSVFNSLVSTKIYDNRHDFDNDRVNCPFWMMMIPVDPLKWFTFHNLLSLKECAVTLQTFMLEIKV